MAEDDDFSNLTVQVFESDRMPDPAVESDVMQGKRFRGASGEPMSILDILKANGLIGDDDHGQADQSGGPRKDAAGV